MEERKKPKFKQSPFAKDKGISQHVDELIDFKLWERFDKPKESEQTFNLKHKVLIMHYVGMLDVFKKGTDRNNIINILLGLNVQTAKEYSGNIDDFELMKNSNNLTIVLKYFKEIKLTSAIDLVNKDFEKLGKRLKTK